MSRAPSFPATSQSVLQLLQPGQALYVPAYQRSYTWGTDQIERLFEDIHAGISRAAQSPGPPTFLGSAILFEGRNSVFPKVNTALPAQVLHVVDGQQRLATMLLILGQARFLVLRSRQALETLERSAELDWIDANLQMLDSQLKSCLWVDLPSAIAAFKLMPRLIRQATDVWGDRETNAKYESDVAYYLHHLAQRQTAQDSPTSYVGRPHLQLVIDSIDDHLRRVADGTEEGSRLGDVSFASDLSTLNRLLPSVPTDVPIAPTAESPEVLAAIRTAAFSQFLLNQVVLIDVRAPDEDTAFALFEPLNTTGQPLTPIETLRPLVVRAEGGLDSHLGSPSDKSFQQIDLYVPDELEATERSKRVSSLLTSFALGQDGTKLAHNMLEQRRYLRTAYNNTTDLEAKRVFIEGIAETARFLSDVWEDSASPLITGGTPADRLSLEVLRASNHVIVVPLLVRYFEQAEQLGTAESEKDFRAVVRAATAFWTIWRSSRTTTSGIDAIHRGLVKSGLVATSLPPLARSATPAADMPTATEVKAALRNLLVSKLDVADAASWSSRLNSQQLYDTARVLARYILLCAHDDAVADPSEAGHARRGAQGSWPTLSIEVWRGHYTVEHIAPQRRRSNDVSYAPALYDEGDISRLGNLTLLPADLNRLVGNKSWPFKRDVFKMVSMTDEDERIAALKRGDLYRLGAKSKALLASSDFMPFCMFVANHEAEKIDRAYIAERGKRMATLAWERLWADLA